jgi:hypothetical protein
LYQAGGRSAYFFLPFSGPFYVGFDVQFMCALGVPLLLFYMWGLMCDVHFMWGLMRVLRRLMCRCRWCFM